MFDPRQPAGRLHERLALAIVVAGIAAALAWPSAPAVADSADSNNAKASIERAVLFEESANDPLGQRLAGSVAWRTEMLAPAPGAEPELAVRGDIQIPDRQMTATWTLRRNTDKSLPASHTIEISFRLPDNFPGGTVDNVPGMLMKAGETARGTPLAGLAVKVTNEFFLIGLSEGHADQQSNMRLLKNMEWLDVPMTYSGGHRAILAVEKGPSGDRAFADAFAAWAK